MLAAEVFARFIGDHSSLVRSANASAAAINKVEASANKAGSVAGGSFKQIDAAASKSASTLKSFGDIALKIGAATGVLALVAGAVKGVKSAFLDYNSALEQSRIGFTTMLGSARAADGMLRQLQSFAAKTPFTFKGLVETTQQLMALGFGARDVLPMVRTVGDTVAAMGGTMEEMGSRVTRALGQMQAKGRVSAEEMMQLAEAGIPAWKYLAEAIGTDIPTAMEKARRGGISSAIAIDAILKGMNSDFGGMMEAQSKTMMGAWSTVMDFLQMNVAKATSSIFNKLRDSVVDLADWMSGPQAAAIGATFAETVSEGFESVIDAVAPVVNRLVDAVQAVGEAGIELLGNLKSLGTISGAAFTVALKGVELFLSAVESLANFFADNEVAAKGLAVAVTVLLTAMAAQKVIAFGSALTTLALNAAAAGEQFLVTSGAIGGGQALSGLGRASAGFKGLGAAMMGAVGGPAGLAVTAGIAGIGLALYGQAQRAKEAKHAFDAYREAIEKAKGVETATKVIEKVNDELAQLKDGHVADALDEIGISITDASAAVRGSDKDFNNLIDQLKAAHDTTTNYGQGTMSLIPILERQRDAFKNANSEVDANAKAMDEEAKALREATAANDLLGNSLGNIAPQMGEATRLMGEAGKGVEEFRTNIEDSLRDAANPFEEFTTDSMVSLDEWEKNLNDRLAFITDWGANIQAAIAQGLSPEAFQYLIDQGPMAMGQALSEMVAGGPGRVNQFNQEVEGYNSAVTGMSSTLEEEFAMMTAILDDGLSTEQLKAQFGSDFQRIFDTMPESARVALAETDRVMQSQIGPAIEAMLFQARRVATDNAIELPVEISHESMAEGMSMIDRFLASASGRNIIVGADPSDALATVAEAITAIGSEPAAIQVEGYDDQFVEDVRSFIDWAESQGVVLDFEGDPEGATATLIELLGQIDRSEGTVAIQGDAQNAHGTLSGLVNRVNASSGTVHINADGSGATATADGIVRYINSLTGRIRIVSYPVPGYQTFGGGMAEGGIVGNSIKPQYFQHGGGPRGTDIVPAWLSPTEMVLNRTQQTRLFNWIGALAAPRPMNYDSMQSRETGNVTVNTEVKVNVNAGTIADPAHLQRQFEKTIRNALAEHNKELARELKARGVGSNRSLR